MIGDQTFIAWIVSALIMSGALIKMFNDAENRVADSTKVRIRRWFLSLKDDDEAGESNWADNFIEVFDSLFGKRFFGARFLLGSFVATTVFFLALVFLFFSYEIITYSSYREFISRNGEAAADKWELIQWLTGR